MTQVESAVFWHWVPKSVTKIKSALMKLCYCYLPSGQHTLLIFFLILMITEMFGGA